MIYEITAYLYIFTMGLCQLYMNSRRCCRCSFAAVFVAVIALLAARCVKVMRMHQSYTLIRLYEPL